MLVLTRCVLKDTMKLIEQLNIKCLGSLFYKGLKENHVRIMNGPATVIGERSFKIPLGIFLGR